MRMRLLQSVRPVLVALVALFFVVGVVLAGNTMLGAGAASVSSPGSQTITIGSDSSAEPDESDESAEPGASEDATAVEDDQDEVGEFEVDQGEDEADEAHEDDDDQGEDEAGDDHGGDTDGDDDQGDDDDHDGDSGSDGSGESSGDRD